jgi:hypothetical protein
MNRGYSRVGARIGPRNGSPVGKEAQAMRSLLWLSLLSLFAADPAVAQDKWLRPSIGYAFAQYLEEGGGNAPVGAYLSIASIGKTVGFEGELAYHRDSLDSEFFYGDPFVLHTLTLGLGPRFALGSAKATPFVHLLGGLRYDSGDYQTNMAFGGMAGGGIDIPLASSLFFRLGADFQIFFDDGENLKTLRLTAGFSF